MAFRKQGKDQFLAVPEETVRRNFEMYQALDSKVSFHKGPISISRCSSFYTSAPWQSCVWMVVSTILTKMLCNYYVYCFVKMGGYMSFR